MDCSDVPCHQDFTTHGVKRMTLLSCSFSPLKLCSSFAVRGMADVGLRRERDQRDCFYKALLRASKHRQTSVGFSLSFIFFTFLLYLQSLASSLHRTSEQCVAPADSFSPCFARPLEGWALYSSPAIEVAHVAAQRPSARSPPRRLGKPSLALQFRDNTAPLTPLSGV